MDLLPGVAILCLFINLRFLELCLGLPLHQQRALCSASGGVLIVLRRRLGASGRTMARLNIVHFTVRSHGTFFAEPVLFQPKLALYLRGYFIPCKVLDK